MATNICSGQVVLQKSDGRMNTIAQIVECGLCTGCGTCAGICPNEAVKMHIVEGLYLPKIEEGKCNECGICVKSCPGYSVDFEELNSSIFRKQPDDASLGNFLGCYIGHSNSRGVRYNSSSGGMATQLAIFALEKGLIDGALVVRMRKDRSLEPEPFIAKTREEVISSSKSKYCPVAANEALKQVFKEDGRFAVVGLPCHIHGIRKAEKLSKILEKRIVLHIGLMCSHTVNFAGTEFLLEKTHIRKELVTELNYRGRGWPGSMSIRVRDYPELTIPYLGSWNAYWPIFSSFFFTPMRCIMCSDETNELADISLGDAWLPELESEKSGQSIIIARTKKAEDILALMGSAKAISIRRVDPEKVKQSQALPLKFKKDDLNTRLLLLKLLGKQTPKFNVEPNSTDSLIARLRALFPYFNIRVSSNKCLKSLLAHVPLPLFRLYYGIHKFLSLI